MLAATVSAWQLMIPSPIRDAVEIKVFLDALVAEVRASTVGSKQVRHAPTPIRITAVQGASASEGNCPPQREHGVLADELNAREAECVCKDVSSTRDGVPVDSVGAHLQHEVVRLLFATDSVQSHQTPF